ncbi:MAG: YfiR family protein [Sulfurovum sp.]|nr:YfiR family protein [Sulfurovum sp.]
MKKIISLFIVFGSLSSVYALNQERNFEAVFLGKFSKFIELPKKENQKFTITLIDKNPFGNLLDKLYKNQTINNLPVEVHYVTKVEDIGESDVLFITLSSIKEVENAIKYAQEHSIISISEKRGFAQRGGIIQVGFMSQKPYFIINHAAAIKSKIIISSQLLAIAKEVIKEDN